MYYNCDLGEFPSEEAPGASVFCKDRTRDIFHIYSCAARGLDVLVGAYDYSDLVSKGRDEDSLAWVRHRDRYADDCSVDRAAVCVP